MALSTSERNEGELREHTLTARRCLTGTLQPAALGPGASRTETARATRRQRRDRSPGFTIAGTITGADVCVLAGSFSVMGVATRKNQCRQQEWRRLSNFM